MDNFLDFQFDGVDYCTDADKAQETGVIQLPCGRQLRVDNWIDSAPVKIGALSLTANHDRFASAVYA